MPLPPALAKRHGVEACTGEFLLGHVRPRLHSQDRNLVLTSPHRQRRKPASIRRPHPIEIIILNPELGSHSSQKPPDALMTEFAASRYG